MKFRSLPGLPAVGDLPIQFSASGTGTHSEGFVAEFVPTGGQAWIGNFQRGLTNFDQVIEHPNGSSVIVIAGGECYIVDPEAKRSIENFGGDLISAWEIPDHDLVVLGSPINFEAIGSSGRSWQSKRISWDGFRNISLNGMTLTGEAWGFEDIWIPFTLDITTGNHAGGADTF